MMEERAHEASSLKHSSESSHLLAAGTTSSPSRRRSIAAASNPDQILEGGSDSSDLSSRDDEDDEDEEEADRRSQGGSSKGSSAAPSMPTSTITSAATSRRSSHSVASHTKHARSATHTGMPTRVASMISGSDFAPPQPPPTDTELDPLTHEDADSDSGDSVASSVASTGGGEGAIGGGAVGGGSVRARPSSSRRSKPSAAFLALLRNTRVDYTLHEVDLYLMSQSARLYSMLLTKRQIARFRHWQATPEKKRGPIKLPGQIGPKSASQQHRARRPRRRRCIGRSSHIARVTPLLLVSVSQGLVGQLLLVHPEATRGIRCCYRLLPAGARAWDQSIETLVVATDRF